LPGSCSRSSIFRTSSEPRALNGNGVSAGDVVERLGRVKAGAGEPPPRFLQEAADLSVPIDVVVHAWAWASAGRAASDEDVGELSQVGKSLRLADDDVRPEGPGLGLHLG
jgi:hypothetical protein